MNEDKRKHLELIQGVVNRLANNSFQLKGWCVTLVTGVLFFSSAVAAEKQNLLLISLAPVAVFWILDGYFLWQERIFRRTFDIVRERTEETNYDMYEADPDGKKLYWIDAIFSTTLIVFYMGLIAAIILLRYFAFC